MVITLVGIALLVLFFVTDETDNFFLPIMLIFIGRTISKRAKRGQPAQKKAGQVVLGGNPTITVETLQDKFRAQQTGSSRQQSVRKSFEDRLREALMVPPMTAPAPPGRAGARRLSPPAARAREHGRRPSREPARRFRVRARWKPQAEQPAWSSPAAAAAARARPA